MVDVRIISDSELVVENSSRGWTACFFIFVISLTIPGILLIVASEASYTWGGINLESVVGALLLTIAALGSCMMAPLTISTASRMNKEKDNFKQEHLCMSCCPLAFLPNNSMPLSSIERVEIDGPEGFESSEDSSEADSEVDERDDDLKEFQWRFGKPRSQVFVRTRNESIPLTPMTSGSPSILAVCLGYKLSATQVRRQIDDFLDFTAGPSGDGDAESPLSSPNARSRLQTGILSQLAPSPMQRKGSKRQAHLDPPQINLNPAGRPITADVASRARPPDPFARHKALAPLSKTVPPKVSSSMFDQPPEGAGRPVPPQPEPPSRAMVFTFGGSAESPPGKLEVQGGFAPGSVGGRARALPTPPVVPLVEALLGQSSEGQPMHKRHMTADERAMAKAAKKEARVGETAEEKAERREKKAEKQASKAEKRAAKDSKPAE